MSSETDVLSDRATPEAPASATTLPWRRLFYWSVRRELWENRAVFFAPLAVAGIILLGFVVSSGKLPRLVCAAEVPGAPHKALGALVMPYDIAAGATFVTALIVAVFYCVGALHGERRDRSILFWKSLPVSDLTSVLAKVAVPLAVLPVVVFVVAVAQHLVMLAWGTVVLLLAGVDPAALWTRVPLIRIWLTLPYGLIVLALWYAPIVGWLLMISAWARRTPILWALSPLGLCLFELLAFRTLYLWSLVRYRLEGGFAEAFTVGGQGKVPIDELSQIDVARFLSLPGLWAGLAFAVATIAAAVWLRRRRDAI